jgi:hypothetical protein
VPTCRVAPVLISPGDEGPSHVYSIEVVRFRYVERDEPVVVSGENRRFCLVGRGAKGNRTRTHSGPPGGWLGTSEALTPYRTGGAQQLNLSPMQEIFRSRQIRNRAVIPAGNAERVRVLSVDQPVADVIPRIGAETVEPARCNQRTPCIAIGLVQSRDHPPVGQIAQSQSAALATRILEIERLPAALALK